MTKFTGVFKPNERRPGLTESQTIHAALLEVFLERAHDALASARSAADVQEAQDSLLEDIASLGKIGGSK